MKYEEFKTAVGARLSARPSGLTWKQLKADLVLPYERPCPEWTHRLEKELGLIRRPGPGQALVWSLRPKGKSR